MEIIAEYALKIFSDGSIKLEKIKDSKENVLQAVENMEVVNAANSIAGNPYGEHPFTGCSSRISQILNIITGVYNNKSATSIDSKITSAITQTAAKYGISTSTCIDKCSRQMGLTMDSFREHIFDSLVNGSTRLETLLLSKTGLHTKKFDEKAIKETFESIRKRNSK